MFTVLESTDAALQKTIQIRDDGTWDITKYPGSKYFFRRVPPPLASIHDLAEFLPGVIANPQNCVVLGKPCGPIPLTAPAPRRSNGPEATLETQNIEFLPVDIDSLLDPAADVLGDPEGTAERVAERLGFADTSFFYQFTASQKPTSNEIRLRLWFKLATPQPMAAAKGWANGLAKGIRTADGWDRAPLPVDPALYGAAQPIYTSAPRFTNSHDPIPHRFGFVEREHDTISIPEVEPQAAHQASGDYTGDQAELASALAAIPSEIELAARADVDWTEWQCWNHLGMAIYRATSGEGFELFDRWSAKSTNYDAAAVRDRWQAISQSPPSHLGAGTVFYWARKYGWTPPKTPEPELAVGPDLAKDLDLLRGCKKGKAKGVAKSILGRYIGRTPRYLSVDELLEQIREAYPGGDGAFPAVRRYASWLERQRKAEARVEIDPARLINASYERRTSLEGLAAEIEKNPGIVYLIKAPMASGKTQSVLRPLAWSETLKTAIKLAVCHRVSLVADLAHVLGCSNYQQADLDVTRELSLCINSFANDKFWSFLAATDVLMVDEISQVLKELLSPRGTMKKEASLIRDRLGAVMERARFVVGCDADLTTSTCNMVAELSGKPVRVIEVVGTCRDIAVEFTERDVGWQAVREAVASGEKILIATDSRAEAERLHAALPGSRVIHSGTSGDPENIRLLSDINAHIHEIDILIYSPAISSGVSLEVPHFTRHFGFYCGAVAPSDICQMFRRDRTAKHFTVAFSGPCRGDGETQAFEVLESLDKTHKRVVKMTQGAQGESLVAYQPRTRFDELICEQVARNNRATNNAAANLIYLLESRGYQVSRYAGSPCDPEILKAAREQAEENYRQSILQAGELSGREREKLERQHHTTSDQGAACTRYDLKKTLGKAPETQPSSEDIEFWDHGKVRSKISRFEALRGGPEAGIETDVEEQFLPLAMRQHRTALGEALQAVFAAVGLNPITGRGEFDAESARLAFKKLKGSKVRGTLEWLQLGRFTRMPAQPVRWVSQVLEKMGLKAECVFKSGQVRRYGIDRERWEKMVDIAEARTRILDRENPIYLKPAAVHAEATS